MMRMYSFNATARNYAVSSPSITTSGGGGGGGGGYLTPSHSSMKQFGTCRSSHFTPSMMVYSQRFPNLRPLTFDRDGVVGSELHMAVLQRDIEAIVWLTQMGANPNDTTSNNESVLHLGVASGVVEIVSFLIRVGAHLNAADDEGDRPLHWAVREGCIPVAQCLLAECASGLLDIDARNADGDSALHLSCSLGDADMTALLLEHGANPNLWNTSKFTALDEALANGHSLLVPLLQNYNARQGYSKQQSAFYPRTVGAGAGAGAAVTGAVVCGVEPFIGTHSRLIGAGAATAAAATTAAIAGLGGAVSFGTGATTTTLNSNALTCSGEHERQQLVVKLQQLSVATNQV